jgi:hypothetical protein
MRTRYKSTRLTFKREVIEALRDDDCFECSTPEGVFRLTKRQFYEAFRGVVTSSSYTERGIYNYARTPARARSFLVPADRARTITPVRPAKYAVHVLDGDEPIHRDAEPIGPTVRDFWRWASSDLLSNALRGVLAEYLVALDLGVVEKPRREWVAWDLETADGIRIEVKSAAYVQGWHQNKPSLISFGVGRTRGWDPDTALFGADLKRHADVYVFCLLFETDRERVDPLDVNHWQFFVVSSADLETHLGAQKQMSLARLREIPHSQVGFGEIGQAVRSIPRTGSPRAAAGLIE